MNPLQERKLVEESQFRCDPDIADGCNPAYQSAQQRLERLAHQCLDRGKIGSLLLELHRALPKQLSPDAEQGLHILLQNVQL